MSLLLVSIFLVANCLATVTTSGSEDFKDNKRQEKIVTYGTSFYTGTPVSVTPVDGTHLSLDYQKSVKIFDYNNVIDLSIRINVSYYNQENISSI